MTMKQFIEEIKHESELVITFAIGLGLIAGSFPSLFIFPQIGIGAALFGIGIVLPILIMVTR